MKQARMALPRDKKTLEIRLECKLVYLNIQILINFITLIFAFKKSQSKMEFFLIAVDRENKNKTKPIVLNKFRDNFESLIQKGFKIFF